jgi:hypothetical protein
MLQNGRDRGERYALRSLARLFLRVCSLPADGAALWPDVRRARPQYMAMKTKCDLSGARQFADMATRFRFVSSKRFYVIVVTVPLPVKMPLEGVAPGPCGEGRGSAGPGPPGHGLGTQLQRNRGTNPA